MQSIVIRGGRLIDPANQRDGQHDLFIDDGRILAIDRAPEGFRPDLTIDATGNVVCPGLIDLCARLREPGLEHKADIASETYAAACSGITTLVCPPDTDPVIDEPAVVELIRRRAEAAAYTRVFTLGALTQSLAGEHLAEMAALKEAGCIGVSNALQPISNTLVLRRSLEYAASHDLTVFLSPIDAWLSDGLAHAGHVATRLGLRGIPVAAETAALARDLALIEEIGVRAHIGRLSSRRAVAMLKRAHSDGLAVTADVAAHQLHLCELDLGRFDSHCHVIPPLRSQSDLRGLCEGIADDSLSAICSDHQPHEADAKLNPFGDTESGISTLETLLPLGLKLVEDRYLTLSDLIKKLTWQPAGILGLEYGRLNVGAVADICIFDLQQRWVLDDSTLISRGRNSPFIGSELVGRVSYTLLQGRLIYQNPALASAYPTSA
jgi:dihydroorotase